MGGGKLPMTMQQTVRWIIPVFSKHWNQLKEAFHVAKWKQVVGIPNDDIYHYVYAAFTHPTVRW